MSFSSITSSEFERAMSATSSSSSSGCGQPIFGSFDFPAELFEKILLNLDAEDFLPASLVSKAWNETMRDSPALRANYDMKIFMKQGGTRIFSAISRCLPWNSGNASAIRALINRLQCEMKEAEENLKNDKAVKRIRKGHFEMLPHPNTPTMLTPDIQHDLGETNTLFKDVDFENNVFAFGALLRSAAVVARLDVMRPLTVLSQPQWRIARCQIYSDWISLGIDSHADFPETRRGLHFILSRGIGCRDAKGTEVWNWTGPAPRKILSLPYVDVRLYPFTHTLTASSMVGVSAVRTSLFVWRFRGDDTTDEAVLSIDACPFGAKTHFWDDFNVDGRNLIAAKKSLNDVPSCRALSIHVFDLVTGDQLWTIRDLPCRSLETRCSSRPSVFFSSYLAEVDVTRGCNIGVISIDTRAARKNRLEALALRCPRGAVLSYSALNADRDCYDHVQIRTKSLFNRVNEHKGNPWLIARRDHYESVRGVFSVEYIYRVLPPFFSSATFADSILRAMSSENKLLVGHFCVFKAEKGDHNNEWTFQLKDYYPAD